MLFSLLLVVSLFLSASQGGRFRVGAEGGFSLTIKNGLQINVGFGAIDFHE